jgi:ABC-type branched-subunit amino acid transport system substrate-binding protein
MKLQIMLLILSITLAGCVGGNVIDSVETPDILVGVITAQSGPGSSISIPGRQAFEIAVIEWNANHDVQIKAIFEDSRGEGIGSVTAFRKLEAQGVAAIITDLTTSTISLGPLAEESQIPLLSYITTSPLGETAGSYSFKTSSLNIDGLRATVDYMIGHNVTTLGLLTEQSDYTISLRDVFKKMYLEQGGNIIAQDLLLPGDSYQTTLAKIVSKSPDAIMIFINSPQTSIDLLEEFRTFDVSIPIYGSENAASDLAARLGGPKAVEGIIFSKVVVDERKLTAFKEKYLTYVGKEDVLTWWYAATGYDAATILFTGIESVGTEGILLKEYLKSTTHAGLGGNVTFGDAGFPKNTVWGLYQNRNGSAIRLD